MVIYLVCPIKKTNYNIVWRDLVKKYLVGLSVVLMAIIMSACMPEAVSDIPLGDQSGRKNIAETAAPTEIKTREIAGIEDLLLFTGENGKTGFIDPEGNILIEPKFYQISVSDEGLIIAAISEKYGEYIYQIYDRTAKKIGPRLRSHKLLRSNGERCILLYGG